MSRAEDLAGLMEFFRIVGRLKHIPRTGWVRAGVSQPETISGHMYRMSIMSFFIQDDSIDRTKVMKLSIVHDIAEAIAGDITPSDGLSKEQKYKAELDGLNQMLAQIENFRGAQEIRSLWEEYENQETPESKIVKELDRLDMVLQANEYETDQKKDLGQFFEGTKNFFKDPQISQWNEQVRSETPSLSDRS